MQSARIRVTLLGGEYWDIQVSAESMARAGGLPPSKPVMLERNLGPRMDGNGDDVRQIWIKPYYRRTIKEELHIFAVEVRHG